VEVVDGAVCPGDEIGPVEGGEQVVRLAEDARERPGRHDRGQVAYAGREAGHVCCLQVRQEIAPLPGEPLGSAARFTTA
jgi:hypothetical protein